MNANFYANRLMEMDCTDRQHVKDLLRRISYLTGESCVATDANCHDLTLGQVKDRLHKMGVLFDVCSGIHLTVRKPHFGSCQEPNETVDKYLRRVLWTNEQMLGEQP